MSPAVRTDRKVEVPSILRRPMPICLVWHCAHTHCLCASLPLSLSPSLSLYMYIYIYIVYIYIYTCIYIYIYIYVEREREGESERGRSLYLPLSPFASLSPSPAVMATDGLWVFRKTPSGRQWLRNAATAARSSSWKPATRSGTTAAPRSSSGDLAESNGLTKTAALGSRSLQIS